MKQERNRKREVDNIMEIAENPGVDVEMEDDDLFDSENPERFIKNDRFSKILSLNYKEEMIFMLESGLNLIIYGIGSKINYLKHFTQNLKGHTVIYGNGYHPGLTLKTLLKELTSYINKNYVKRTKTSSVAQMDKFFSMHDNIEYLMKTLSLESIDIKKIYIVINSLDAGNLKSLELQRYLSILARCRKIGLIITLDTLKPGAFWDDSVLDRYNFVYYQIDTYEEFHLEKSLIAPLFSMKNEREELGLSYILKSLTSSQIHVMKMMAKFQLDNPNEIGMKEKELFEDCIDNQVVFDIKSLKDLLKEMRDHKILYEKEDKEGNSFLYLKLKNNILEKILNNQLSIDD